MASLTPGVLSKLLENAGNKHVKITGEHRSPLLQVIEIVPSLDDDPFLSRGFFLKLSDSLHSAYVSISHEDIDLIFSDKIQLGQFVYVSRFDPGSPVPVVCGLKVVPKRRPCIGSPKDLVSSDLLQIRPRVEFKKNENIVDGKTKTKLKKDDKAGTRKAEGLELRRLSLDSARKAWNPSPTPKASTKSKIVKGSVNSSQSAASVAPDKKHSSKNVSSTKYPSISPLPNKNGVFSPKSPLEKVLKSTIEGTVPSHLLKVSLNYKTWSSQKISMDVFPPAIQDIGKEALYHRNSAFLSAVYALEEAWALDAVLYCLQEFAELSNSTQEASAGLLVEQFLDVHQQMQRAAMVVNSLIDAGLRKAKLSTFSSQHLLTDEYSTVTRKNATSWVHAAIETDLSKFSLFRKPENSKIVNSEKYYYVVLENTVTVMNCKSNCLESKPSSRNCGSFSSDSIGKWSVSPTKQNFPSKKKMNPERKKSSKGIGLKEVAVLAEKLLLSSQQWFLKYLEDSLNMGFGLNREGSSEIAHLLKQLKSVNEWLDDLIRCGTEADGRIEDLRKKLYKFLLEHVDSTVVAGK